MFIQVFLKKSIDTLLNDMQLLVFERSGLFPEKSDHFCFWLYRAIKFAMRGEIIFVFLQNGNFLENEDIIFT